MVDPLDRLDGLDERERSFLESPDNHDFRQDPVIEQTVDRQIGDDTYKFQVDILNQIVTLLSGWDRAEYTSLENGQEYSLYESRKHVSTDGAIPDETYLYYLVSGDETYRYEGSGYTQTSIRIPTALEEVEIDEIVEHVKDAPPNRRPHTQEVEFDTPNVDTRPVPPEKDSVFHD